MFAGAFPVFLFAQTAPIGSLPDNTLRSLQLMGKIDPSVSFAVRPMLAGNLISFRSLYQSIDSTNSDEYLVPVYFLKKKGQVSILPISIIQQFNSHHPYGWNDGSMIAAKGLQSQVSGGVFATLGPLEVQFQPEFVFATNPAYETNGNYGSLPNGSYQKFFPGQSHIKLSAGPVSLGMSTENLWWGPGINSSLLMSNNAPGFLHGFFSTNRPVNTPIGSFEWQVIGAKLTSDNEWAYENRHLRKANLPNESRYYNAYVISYQPKWIPGLFLGMTRGIQVYKKDIILSNASLLNQYIPVLLKPFQKKDAQGDDTLNTDQLASFFLRWVLPKSQAEFYIEYGFNDYNYNVRDYVMSPTHSAAYLVGGKKIFNLLSGAYLDIGFEMTQLSQSPDYLIRQAGNWYEHSQVLQGYTNQNQIIGAGAGFGSNVQTATVKWVKGWKQLGVMLERVERDPIYYLNKWTDISIGILPQYKYGNVVFTGKFQFINSSNYAWEKDKNRFNLHSRLAIQYLF